MSLRERACIGILSLGLSVPVVLSGIPANAVEPTCPGRDGTVPGSASSITVIGTGGSQPYLTIYIDDRDAFDLDGDGEASGIWIYIESNHQAGLTRGADWVANEHLDAIPKVHVEPIPVLPPDPDRPVLPHGLTLFPNGWGGEGYPEHLGWHDDCVEYGGENQPDEPDTLIF